MVWDIHWGIYNCLNCDGFVTSATNLGPVSFDIGSPCMMAKLGIVILFFIIAVVRKWGAEEWGVPFSLLWSCIFGIGLYILAITFTGSIKLAMMLGIVGMLIGGYGSGYLFGGSEGDVQYG
jgi:hypothetical protein